MTDTTASPLPVWRQRRTWLLLGVAIALGLGWWLLRRGPLLSVHAVQQRDFVQTVVASGHVEAPHRVDIGAQVTGTVVAVPVAEGATVKAGEVLVRLDDTEARASLRQADAAVAQAEQQLRQLGEVQLPVADQSLRQAQVTRDNARAQWQRQQDLFNQGFIGQAALDDARKALDLAESQWRAAQAQAAAVATGGSNRAGTEQALVQARAAAAATRARLGYTTLVAPEAGVLIDRSVEVGSVVQAGKTLLTLSPAGPTQLVLSVDEKNLRLLALGQTALASADAYARQRFPARVAYINPGVNAATGAVDVKLDVPEPPAYLRQDMTVSVDIEVARRPRAVLVPTESVQDLDSAQPWVWRVQGGVVTRQPVHLGLRSPSWTEVRDGLKPGDQVAAAGTVLQEGQRVRPVALAASAP
ncbi:efflux RND transporter periplasmic adaptor subunit [Ideonella sp. B7]|uniref:efflux RND transporter periplasmic adaptor subunit n=1 Tax=Ideonella benzenivorans TaxID=2831643 RepID=UPI001CEDBE25|nr:efflux RND transporter periplasmic adaptor subunit [Ideonella benzenivorans]MCA6215251.1 efflux RND transporter periplasmic adaptor subunit [Ideonella benzenivorans]